MPVLTPIEWLALVFALLIGALIGWVLRNSFAQRTERRLRGALAAQARQSKRDEADAPAELTLPIGGPLVSAEKALNAARDRSEALAAEVFALRKQVVKTPPGDAPDVSPAPVEAATSAPIQAAPIQSGPTRADLTAEEALDLDQLSWRNRYLEARVGVLETKLGDAANAVASAPAPSVIEDQKQVEWRKKYSEARIAYLQQKLDEQRAEQRPATAEDRLGPGAAEAKTLWRNRYLEARLRYLEARLKPVDEDTPTQSEPPPVAQSRPTDEVDPNEAARLKWRNRYLEGRLKYVAASGADPVSSKSVRVPSQPPQFLDRPREGRADDLQKINGIGPRSEAILHDLGVFHIDQIADWDDAAVGWIERYLRFKGRVSREDWVGQAKALATA